MARFEATTRPAPAAAWPRTRAPLPRTALVTATVLLLAGAWLLAPSAFGGTWQWRDHAGHMVYSDRPPPPEVRADRIVATPNAAAPTTVPRPAAPDPGARPAAPEAGTPRAGSARAAPAAAPLPDWTQRERASRKRAAEREEAERAAGERAASDARTCEMAREAERTLASGRPLALVNARGERETLDEAERARRLQQLREQIARACPPLG